MIWQPIETAPKDGTPVLLFCLGGEMITALWHSVSGWNLVQVGANAEDADVYPAPTHWMPLPPPPEAL